jgi:tRNA (cmo5U34)-methyltransferase
MSEPPSKDTLYAQPNDVVAGFRFDQAVVDVFPDMIQRSVPGYATIVHTIGDIAARYAQPNTRCYDLGCSLGAATLAMRQRIEAEGVEIVAIDNSVAMIESCRSIIDSDDGNTPVQLVCANIQDVTVNHASVCVLNFTLQFIPVQERLDILKRLYDGLVPGGVLILSEKLAFDEPDYHQLMIDLHHNFKRTHGYSDLEIAQKRSALENVLMPETVEAHKTRLAEAGFRSTDLWFQCFNFASFLAFK